MSNSTELVRVDGKLSEAPRRNVFGIAKKVGIVAVAAGLVGGVTLPAVAMNNDAQAGGQLPSMYSSAGQGGTAVEGETVVFPEDAFVATSAAELEEMLAEEAAEKKAEEEQAGQEQQTAGGDAAGDTGASESDDVQPAGGGNQAVVNAALAQLGVTQWCTELVQKAVAASGTFTWTGYGSLSQLKQVPMSEAQPGDILYYADGGIGLQHVAIYIGDGKAVHGGWGSERTTAVSTAYVGSGPIAYSLGG